MAFAPDYRRLAIAWGAIALTALMAFFGTGMHPLWPLLWFAPIPLLLVAPRMSRLGALGGGVLAWVFGGFNIWRYLRNVLGTRGPASIAVALLILTIPAIFFGLAVLAWRRFVTRGAIASAAVAFPAAWVSYEYLSATFSPHSTFGNLAYTQMDFLPIVQLAAVTGVWGVSFCLFLFPATVAALLIGDGNRARLSTIAGVFFIAVFAFGIWRFSSVPAAKSVRVGLAASDIQQNLFPQDEGPETARLLRGYLDQATRLAQRGAQVIVIPEKLGVVVDPDDTRQTDVTLQAFADRNNADFVAGLIRVANPLKFNEARTYQPSSGVLVYEKHHMLPAFESKFEPGTTQALMTKPSGVWGVAICKDMDFPALSRGYGKAGTGLLLVPAWDFVDDGWLHGRMAVMRGVESGFSIVRAAKEGLLTVSDDRGQVLAQQRSDAAPFATLLADAPVRHVTTPYLLFGDWFAWLTLAALAIVLLKPR